MAVIDSPIESDHRAVLFSLLAKHTNYATNSRLDYHRADFTQIALNVASVNWPELFRAHRSSVEDMYAVFLDVLRFFIAFYTPCARPRGFSSPLHAFIERASTHTPSARDPPKFSRELSRASARLRRRDVRRRS